MLVTPFFTESAETLEQVPHSSCGFLEMFKARLNGTLSSLVLWKVSLFMAGD